MEDLQPHGDVTTQLIKNKKKLKAKIISNQKAINNTEAAHKLKEKKVIITKLIQSKKKNKKLKKNKHLLLALVVALRLKKY